jgi:hypothetical protein
MAVLIPRICPAQCLCNGGIPATPVVQLVNFGPTTAANLTIPVPKFVDTSASHNESLSCITLHDTIWAVSTSHVTNTDAIDSATEYKFDLSVNYTLKGPAGGGFNINNGGADIIYGPDSLGMFGSPTDTITYGPDTTINKVTDIASTSNVVPYIGAGTANFTFSLGGGLTSKEGGLNYNYQIKTDYWGIIKLTYYWCPNVALATSIGNFTATPNGGAILLQWTDDNQQPNTTYEIQVSTDGTNFTSVGETENDAATAGTSAKYQYQYNPDPSHVGRLYFRIKETDASGQVTFSAVLVVTPSSLLTGHGQISYQAFPNPATHSLIFQFNGNQTGRFLVELVNTAGQPVVEKAVTLTGTSQIQLDLDPHPVPGLYFLRTTDQTRNKQYVTKVFVK